MRNLITERLTFHPRNQKVDKEGGEYLELRASIKANGILTPILVRRIAGGYQIIGGHRRTTAALDLGIKRVPARIIELSDAQALTRVIQDNTHRRIPTGIEWLNQVLGLREEGKTRVAIAAALGKGEQWVMDVLKLRKLSDADKAKAEKQGWSLNKCAEAVIRTSQEKRGVVAKPTKEARDKSTPRVSFRMLKALVRCAYLDQEAKMTRIDSVEWASLITWVENNDAAA